MAQGEAAAVTQSATGEDEDEDEEVDEDLVQHVDLNERTAPFFMCALAEYDSGLHSLKQSLEALQLMMPEGSTVAEQRGLARLMAAQLSQQLLPESRQQEATWDDMAEALLQLWNEKRTAFVHALAWLATELEQLPPGAWPRAVPTGQPSAELLASAAQIWGAEVEGVTQVSYRRLQAMLLHALELSDAPGKELLGHAASGAAVAGAAAVVATCAGADLSQLLQPSLGGSSDGFAGAATTFATWTAPYVGLALLARAAAPSLAPLSTSIVRGIPYNQQQLFRQASVVEAAAVVLLAAACQCFVFQGLWLPAFTAWMGGSRDALLLSEPDLLADQLPSAMGTLVGAPRLPAALVAPLAAVLTGVLEGGWYLLAVQFRGEGIDWSVTWDDNVVGYTQPPPYDGSALPSADEVVATAARVALAGAYLSLEASLTGCLWLPVATSAAGMLTAVALCKAGTGDGDGGSDSET